MRLAAPSCELTLSQLLELLAAATEVASMGTTAAASCDPMLRGSVCDRSLRLERLGASRRSLGSGAGAVAEAGALGDVGDASGLRLLVRGGGGGGTRRPPAAASCCSSSALRSGTGGFLEAASAAVDLAGWMGGLLSVSEPLG